MMRWNGFAKSLLFGAVAAAGFAPFALVMTPWTSVQWALVAYAMGVVPAYLVGLGDTRRRGMGAAGLAALLIVGLTLLNPSPREALIGVALALALARSGVAHPRTFAASVALESVIGLGALCVAQFLIGTSVLSIVLAIWGFFLVQSVYFVFGRSAAASNRNVVDPFDEARDRANAILDGALDLH